MRFPVPDPAGRAVLHEVLERARRTRGVVVFDLDSTVFDNRPRQVEILRAYGRERGIPELERSELAHWPHGFGLEAPMRAAGLSPERVAGIARDARAFWHERFFTSAWCVHDLPIPGAVAYVRAVRSTGAAVVYCTGRPASMREGTVFSLRRHALPVPGEERVELVMKPLREQHDDEFKSSVHERLSALGEVIAAFDNEPAHVNAYRRSFPSALVVHLATDHSGRPIALDEGVPAVADFELP